MAARFHSKCGDRVTLMNGNTTAVRSFVEFNHGLTISDTPLEDDVLFEVRLDRKVNVWNGSLEIGVMTSDPVDIDLPATATKLRNTAWILSGSAVIKDGITILFSYGPELETLCEGDCIGVMRTSHNELMFYVNGKCLGVAATGLPPVLYAVIDLYGQCVQVSVCNTDLNRPYMHNYSQPLDDPNNDDTLTTSDTEVIGLAALESYFEKTADSYFFNTDMDNDSDNFYASYNNSNDNYGPIYSNAACACAPKDELKFHQRCGILVKMSAGNKSAERVRPLDDYNNGVIMTHRPLHDNELFEVRIDKLVDKWSGSIEMGVTSHDPATLRFPSTMTNMDTGTIMMSGCKILINGQGTCNEYGNYNLDELREGGTVGLMISNGKLHYYINGVDQGLATDKVGPQVWGVVDLYGMTVKVTIIEPSDSIESPSIEPMPLDTVIELMDSIGEACALPPEHSRTEGIRIDHDNLLFHSLRDSNVIVINDGKTAHRPNAFEHFNNGVVMTHRTLRTNEMFLVRLDSVIPKWAGSIEIGVTQLSCYDMQSPFKMSNAECGTWVLTGEDVIHDGSIVVPQYVTNLNTLVQGDTVGVVRRPNGVLHFYVNGQDLGPAAFNVPEYVYGVIDLYGRVAQVTIVDPEAPYSPDSDGSSDSNTTVYPEMCFHRVHGRNARLSRTRLTASRATVYSEFNDAVLFSSRPLRECEMFELRIDRMVDCWIGSLEIGVTAIRPEQMDHDGESYVAGTATDLSRDTYILSGAAVMKDGECVRSGYALDLDCVTVGSRVGIMWHSDRSLHYYLDGMDQGKAWYVPHLNIYAVVDLYGQCTQVTILQNEERLFNFNGYSLSDNSMLSNPRTLVSPQPPYCFSEYCGNNIALLHDYTFARRMADPPGGALVFSAGHLAQDELFEIKVVEMSSGYAGSLRIGVTGINILNAHVNRSLPNTVAQLPPYTAYIDGCHIKYTIGYGNVDLRSIIPSFEWLRVNDCVGLKKLEDSRVQVYYNTEPLDVFFEDVPQKVYVVMELSGNITKIQAISKLNITSTTIPQPSAPPAEELSVASAATGSYHKSPEAPVHPRRGKQPLPYTFHYVHGRNIKLTSSDTVAVRTAGYKDGMAIVSQPLRRGQTFRFRVDKTDCDWSGSMGVGAVASLPAEGVPPSVSTLKPPAWLLAPDLLIEHGQCITTRMAEAFEELGPQSVLALHFRVNGDLVLDIGGVTLGILGQTSRSLDAVYPLVDLYGRVTQVSIMLHPQVKHSGSSIDLPIIREKRVEEVLPDTGRTMPSGGPDPREQETSETRAQNKIKALQVENIWSKRVHTDVSSARTFPADDEDARARLGVLRPVSKSRSQELQRAEDERVAREVRERLLRNFRAAVAPDHQDTNIEQNDQFPEADDLRGISDMCLAREVYGQNWEDECYLEYLLARDGAAADVAGAQAVPWPGEARGDGGCEHAHLVLKMWRWLACRQPELYRLPVTHRCYCARCAPDAVQDIAGWVLISCSEDASYGPEAEQRRFLHVANPTLIRAATRAAEADAEQPTSRPARLLSKPMVDALPQHLWYDEEGKPHNSVIAVQIELDRDMARDRITAFLIYLKPGLVFIDDYIQQEDE